MMNTSQKTTISTALAPKEPFNFSTASSIFFLGVCVLSSGQTIGWNFALTTGGFGMFIIATIIMSSAYFVFTCSVAEITSAIPFAGGAYGLARCTLGNCAGFLIGGCEFFEYVMFSALNVYPATSAIAALHEGWFDYQWVMWIVIYGGYIFVNFRGGQTFWMTSNVIAIITIILVYIFILGQLSEVNISRWGPVTTSTEADADDVSATAVTAAMGGAFSTMATTSFTRLAQTFTSANNESTSSDQITDDAAAVTSSIIFGNINDFLMILPVPAWFYYGIEILNLAGRDLEQPRKNIPIGQVVSITYTICTTIIVVCVACASPPGTEGISGEAFPLSPGFHRIFNLSDSELGIAISTLFSQPANLACAYVLIYGFTRLMNAMSESGLFASVLSTKFGKHETPALANLVGVSLSFMICWLQYKDSTLFPNVYNAGLLCAMSAYTAQCIGYIHIKTTFKDLPREFHSPFGIAGALYAMTVWVTTIVAIIFFQTTYNSFFLYLTLMGCLLVYYFLVARWFQKKSQEETDVLQVAIDRLKSSEFELLHRIRTGGADLNKTFEQSKANIQKKVHEMELARLMGGQNKKIEAMADVILIVHDALRCGYFLTYLESVYSAENLTFCLEVLKLRKLLEEDRGRWNSSWKDLDEVFLNPNQADILEDISSEMQMQKQNEMQLEVWPSSIIDEARARSMAQGILENYLRDDVICLPHGVLKRTESRMKHFKSYGAEVFGESLLDPLITLNQDCYPGFLKSKYAKDMKDQIGDTINLPSFENLETSLPTLDLLNGHIIEDYVNFPDTRKFTLQEILHDSFLYTRFLDYLTSLYCSENLLCYRICEEFQAAALNQDQQLMKDIAWKIYLFFIAEKSCYMINFSSADTTTLLLQIGYPKANTFDRLKQVMLIDLEVSFKDYIRTPEYRSLASEMREDKKKYLSGMKINVNFDFSKFERGNRDEAFINGSKRSVESGSSEAVSNTRSASFQGMKRSKVAPSNTGFKATNFKPVLEDIEVKEDRDEIQLV